MRFVRGLRGRVLVILLATTALPALVVGVIALDNAQATVREGTGAQLTAVADL